MSVLTMTAVEWAHALRRLASEHGVPLESKFRVGLNHLRENVSQLQHDLGRQFDLPEPYWDARCIRRALITITDWADDLIDEAGPTKSVELKKLGCRLRISCVELRDGIVELGIPQAEAVPISEAESKLRNSLMITANELFEKSQRDGATQAEKDAARIAGDILTKALFGSAEAPTKEWGA